MTNARHTYLRTHAISGRVLTVDLKANEASLMERARESRAGRAAKTLVKDGPLRVALVAITKGTSLQEHAVAGGVSIQVLRGRLRLRAENEELELRAGEMVAIGDDVQHDATALADAAILITMSMSAS
jgi:quercetin dioxygenase-like cupin family protein